MARCRETRVPSSRSKPLVTCSPWGRLSSAALMHQPALLLECGKPRREMETGEGRAWRAVFSRRSPSAPQDHGYPPPNRGEDRPFHHLAGVFGRQAWAGVHRQA